MEVFFVFYKICEIATFLICDKNFILLLGNKPQTLLFSATMPSWVRDASRKYMNAEQKMVDLVGDRGHQTASGVEV